MHVHGKQASPANCPAAGRADHGAVIDFGGEQFSLLPERAAWWPAAGALFIADLHVGKDATFRAAGIPVPDTLTGDLERLATLIRRLEPRQLFILGDLVHAREAHSRQIDRVFSAWRDTLPELAILLVRGNHDRRVGDPPANWRVTCIDEPAALRHIQLRHCPMFDDKPATLAGHLHPKHRLARGPDRLRLPCFLHRRNTLVLPAFSGFIDHDVIKTDVNDGVYLIADSEVIPLTA